MLTREQKKKIVEDLTRELRNARGVVFSNFQGLPTKELQELRALLRKQQVSHQVVKNTLFKRVLRQTGVDTEKFNYQVPLAVSYSQEDEVMPAKLLMSFAKTHEQLEVLGGILDHQIIAAAEVKSLASLPGKPELRAQIVGTIAAPLRGLVSALQGNLRKLVYALNVIGSKNLK